MSTGTNFERVVLAVDVNSGSEPALSIAAALADAVGTLELLTIVADDLEPARLRLQLLADRYRRLSVTCTALQANTIGATVADHVTSRPGALLVIGSTGPGPLTRPSDRHPTRNVLAHTDRPTLVVGDRVDPRIEPRQGTLVVCVDTTEPYSTSIEAVERWCRAFSSDPVWIAEVVPTVVDRDAQGESAVHRWATALQRLDVHAGTRVLHGGDPAAELDQFATAMPNPIFVTTSRRYSDPRRHLHSVTRDLIHRSHYPVLVVPHRRRNPVTA